MMNKLHMQLCRAASVLLLLALVCAGESLAEARVGDEQKLAVETSREQQEAALASKIALAAKSTRWNRFENLHRGSPTRDQLSGGAGGGELNENLVSGSGQPQQYACGRALASRKYEKHSFELASSSRSKYRPFEIRTPRIIGGDETNPGEFPWTVSVKLNGQPICGGSLINKSWILTAAHCVVGYNPRNLTVRLGAYRIKDASEQQTIDSPISLFIVHKQYSMPRPFSNDIALLKMAEPVEYSDFIIPICLPTEDQISTSLVNEIASDYVPKVFTSLGSSSSPLAEDFETSEGIVVSTKMSDKEISRCFKRLEQNYLNSIGLGTSSGNTANEDPATVAATGAEQEGAHSGADQRTKNKYLMPPLPIDLIPVKVVHNNELDLPLAATKFTPTASEKSPLNSISDSDSNSQLGPMFVTTNNENSAQNFLANNHLHYETHTITNNNNKINFPAFSDFNDFEQAQASQNVNANQLHGAAHKEHHDHHHHHHLNQQQQQQQNVHMNALNDASDTLLMNNQHQVSEHQDFNKYQAYYQALAWSQRKADGKRNEEPESRGVHARSGASAALLTGNEHKAIKLTSLPISKELLREIQSVGSMQSLTLGLQQGDFAAMADDLNGAAVPSGYAAADRERVLTTGGPTGAHQSGARQVVRDTDLIANELDTGHELLDGEPTKYSGMTGIVVGWGWVRENDNDNEQSMAAGAGQRSYQSVTLQKVRLPILRNSDCEAWFRSQEKKITLLPSQFCAGFNSGGKDACRGDSGGPMIIEDNSDTGRYKLIGIVSAGIGCARPSLPGLYTRVASFLPWIHAQMQHH